MHEMNATLHTLVFIQKAAPLSIGELRGKIRIPRKYYSPKIKFFVPPYTFTENLFLKKKKIVITADS